MNTIEISHGTATVRLDGVEVGGAGAPARVVYRAEDALAALSRALHASGDHDLAGDVRSLLDKR